MTYAIAAAGTGGHVFPGLAVGEALVAGGVERADVLFVGGTRLEASVYPEAGFPFLSVELMGLQRRLTTQNLKLPMVVKRAVDRIAAEFVTRNVGVALGLGIHALVAHYGIDVTALAGGDYEIAGIAFGGKIYSRLTAWASNRRAYLPLQRSSSN